MRINAKEVISGVITAVIIVSSTVGYVAFIFSGSLSGTLHFAIGFGLFSAGVMAIIFALGSGAPFAIAGPDSKPTAVLAITAALIAAQLAPFNAPADVGLIVLAALVVGTLVIGVALYVLGATKMGKWIRFVPFPVVSGFMAASGWLLGLGGIAVLAGAHMSWSEVGEIASGHHLPQILAGLGFATALWLSQRIRNPLTFPALLVATVVLVHAVRVASGCSIEAAREAGWLLNVGRNSEIANPLMLLHAVQAIDLHTAALAGGEFIGLFAVTAITLLLGLVVVEVEGRLDVDLDRELRLNGLANILVGLSGGMVGTLSVSRTLFNLRAGGSGRASGVIAGVLCLGVLGVGTDVLIYFPVPVLGGLLVHQGAVMLHEWLIRTRRAMPIAEYLQIIIIMLVIIEWNFLAGVAVGVVSACVTFAINTSRVRLVKQVVDRSSYRSRVDRAIAHQEVLTKYGSSIPIMWLHGFVFFGGAHRLLLDVKQIVETRGYDVCRSLILDFRQVLGIDLSAILNLSKLWNFAEREGLLLRCRRYRPQSRRRCATAACSARRTKSEGCFPIWTPRWNGGRQPDRRTHQQRGGVAFGGRVAGARDRWPGNVRSAGVLPGTTRVQGRRLHILARGRGRRAVFDLHRQRQRAASIGERHGAAIAQHRRTDGPRRNGPVSHPPARRFGPGRQSQRGLPVVG